jgi:hypothetical protein
MKGVAPIVLSSFLLAAACAQNPKPNDLTAIGDASLAPQVGQPPEPDLLVVFTPQPSYAGLVVQSRGRSKLIAAEGEGGGAAASHRFLKPADVIAISSATSVPRRCGWGQELTGGLDANGRIAYRRAIICGPASSTASAWQPKQLPAFAIAIASSDPITDDELALAAATSPDRDPAETARLIVKRLSANDPNARWSAVVRQMTY